LSRPQTDPEKQPELTPELSFDELAHAVLLSRHNASLLRSRVIVTPISATRALIDGRVFTHFAGNNYLGLAQAHDKHVPAAIVANQGSGAAALIAGQSPELDAAEHAIAAWKQSESAVILPSGYQANIAAVQTAAAVVEQSGRSPRFIFDKLIHASLIDAIRSTQARFRVYPHQDYAKLERLLAQTPEGTVNIVVAESVFSMDGDLADLAQLSRLKRDFGFVYILDEAHASGVFGPSGSGLAHQLGLHHDVDLGVVTLSKAVGVSGGAIYGSTDAINAVVNFGRAYIYTTAISPAHANVIQQAIEKVIRADDRRQRLWHNIGVLRELFAARLIKLGDQASPIIPVVLGDEAAAIEVSQRLRSSGLFVPVVRPPTVPAGTSRLRITLCSEHSEADLISLANAMKP